jgi:hypothetical protein
MFCPFHYEYLCGLTILEENVIGADLGGCIGSDTGHFLGYGPNMIEVYVG